ncbi:MAG: calcium/sodium antiporter [Candidatus Cloacimonetes bacterium]|nr:calcium/sodium antiporter [Candidatus Cloacimonadota bacterium]
MINLILLILGFVPLMYGANILVDSASSLAKRFNIPNIVIGLTIVAFGTSAPELIVNVFASLSDNSSIILGNVIGSNIINIFLILGISSIIYPLTVKSNTTWIEIPLCLMSAFCVLIIANDNIIANAGISIIDRIDGIILLMFFLVFAVYNFQLMKSGNYEDEIPTKDYTVTKAVILVIVGIALLVIGGKIIVSYAVNFAKFIGLSDRIIALTIVSLGTSLPELTTSAVAAKKKNVDIAIGNIVGSNIFNVFLILGISAVISPIRPPMMSNLDLIMNVISSVLLFLFIFTGKGRKLERWEGIIFLVVYVFYLTLMLTNTNPLTL